jgi:hypothetical protein
MEQFLVAMQVLTVRFWKDMIPLLSFLGNKLP